MPYQPLQQRRIDAGRCKDCGSDRGSDGTSIRCRPCSNAHNADVIRKKQDLRADWQTAGPAVCNLCGARVEDEQFKSCHRCRAKRRAEWERRAAQRRQQRVDAGKCATCLRPAESPSRYCRMHIIGRCLGYVPMGQREALWQKLVAQGFRCHYTGIALIPGMNLSIDHRVPTIRGGSRGDLANLVWCDKDVNAFKRDLTDVEFIDRCRTIAARFAA